MLQTFIHLLLNSQLSWYVQSTSVTHLIPSLFKFGIPFLYFSFLDMSSVSTSAKQGFPECFSTLIWISQCGGLASREFVPSLFFASAHLRSFRIEKHFDKLQWWLSGRIDNLDKQWDTSSERCSLNEPHKITFNCGNIEIFYLNCVSIWYIMDRLISWLLLSVERTAWLRVLHGIASVQILV